ncbi:MAG: hypothetical protein KIS90_13995 [Phenylobacterium sp.]|nr:hypothetical protein [Phenylobacterium sp.]
MQITPIIREMLGEPLANAVEAAQVRLTNDTVIARCAMGVWSVEVDGDEVAGGLSYADAVDAVEAL